ncbi:MAG TPA: GC-type dockerin domain-anchored protein [Phycisphaerales bacterium]|nr:GC-type dockerin domain-anchored protein [Phycisphaerales bacterium]
MGGRTLGGRSRKAVCSKLPSKYFFTSNPLADVGCPGGVDAPDGHFDNNDFVVFIDRFFAGC